MDGFIDSVDMNLSKLQVMEDRGVWVLQSMELQIVRHDLATEQQQRGLLSTLWVGLVQSAEGHKSKI